MRNRIIIILLLLFSITVAAESVQPSVALRNFKKTQLPSFSDWFYKAEFSDTGHLRLYTAGSFTKLTTKAQKNIMKDVMVSWCSSLKTKLTLEKSFIEVVEPLGGSLWRRGREDTDPAQLVEERNLVSPMGSVIPTSRRGPWYMYFGGGMQVTGDILFVGTNFRIGTYLLNNYFDSSLNLNLSYAMDFVDLIYSLDTSYGILTRFHFPVYKEYSGNVGVMLRSSGTSSFVIGAEKFLYNGVLDVMLSLNAGTALSVGWNTFF